MKTSSVVLCALVAALASPLANAQTSAAPAQDGGASSHGRTAQSKLVKKEEHAANRELVRRVRKQIYAAKGMAGAEVVVFAMAKSGSVLLAGLIDDPAQDKIATDAAKSTPGVTSVTSKLTLRTEGG